MARKIKVNTGDIFSIELDAGRYCFGQVLELGGLCDYLIIFDYVSDDHSLFPSFSKEQVVFLVPTVASRIENGTWNLIGNDVCPEIPIPLYKVETEDGYQLMNHFGDIIDEDPAQEVLDTLKEFESWSPASVENAARTKFLSKPWDPYYENLIFHP